MGVLHMDSRTRRTASWWWTAALMLLAALAAYAGKPAVRTGEAAPAPAQDVIRIESRLSGLEQRLYTIETSIRGLEQQVRLSSATSGRAARDPEIGLLRAEVETLGRRLAEIECGLAKVDERTLSAAAKESRRKSAGGVGDPCRLNSDAPVRLPARP
jgi:hypothetical protein